MLLFLVLCWTTVALEEADAALRGQFLTDNLDEDFLTESASTSDSLVIRGKRGSSPEAELVPGAPDEDLAFVAAEEASSSSQQRSAAGSADDDAGRGDGGGVLGAVSRLGSSVLMLASGSPFRTVPSGVPHQERLARPGVVVVPPDHDGSTEFPAGGITEGRIRAAGGVTTSAGQGHVDVVGDEAQRRKEDDYLAGEVGVPQGPNKNWWWSSSPGQGSSWYTSWSSPFRISAKTSRLKQFGIGLVGLMLLFAVYATGRRFFTQWCAGKTGFAPFGFGGTEDQKNDAGDNGGGSRGQGPFNIPLRANPGGLRKTSNERSGSDEERGDEEQVAASQEGLLRHNAALFKSPSGTRLSAGYRENVERETRQVLSIGDFLRRNLKQANSLRRF